MKKLWPAYLAILKTSSGFGSAFLVGDRHLITCSHVVFSAPDDIRRSRAGRAALFHPELNARIPRGHDCAEALLADGVSRRAQFVRASEKEDLALLELDRPAFFAASPPLRMDFPDHDKTAETPLIALGGGVLDDSGAFCLEATDLDYAVRPSSAYAGEQPPITLLNAPVEGMSGGPVICRQRDAPDVVAGVTMMGGEAAAHSKMIPAAAVRELLRWARLDTLIDAAGASAAPEGYRNSFSVNCNGAALEFVNVGLSSGGGQLYMAQRPLDRSVFAAAESSVRAGSLIDDVADAARDYMDQFIGLSDGLPFRLPTTDELERVFAAGKTLNEADKDERFAETIDLSPNAPAAPHNLSKPAPVSFLADGGAEWALDPGAGDAPVAVGYQEAGDFREPSYRRGPRAGLLTRDRACLRPCYEVRNEKLVRRDG